MVICCFALFYSDEPFLGKQRAYLLYIHCVKIRQQWIIDNMKQTNSTQEIIHNIIWTNIQLIIHDIKWTVQKGPRHGTRLWSHEDSIFILGKHILTHSSEQNLAPFKARMGYHMTSSWFWPCTAFGNRAWPSAIATSMPNGPKSTFLSLFVWLLKCGGLSPSLRNGCPCLKL